MRPPARIAGIAAPPPLGIGRAIPERIAIPIPASGGVRWLIAAGRPVVKGQAVAEIAASAAPPPLIGGVQSPSPLPSAAALPPPPVDGSAVRSAEKRVRELRRRAEELDREQARERAELEGRLSVAADRFREAEIGLRSAQDAPEGFTTARALESARLVVASARIEVETIRAELAGLPERQGRARAKLDAAIARTRVVASPTAIVRKEEPPTAPLLPAIPTEWRDLQAPPPTAIRSPASGVLERGSDPPVWSVRTGATLVRFHLSGSLRVGAEVVTPEGVRGRVVSVVRGIATARFGPLSPTGSVEIRLADAGRAEPVR